MDDAVQEGVDGTVIDQDDLVDEVARRPFDDRVDRVIERLCWLVAEAEDHGRVWQRPVAVRGGETMGVWVHAHARGVGGGMDEADTKAQTSKVAGGRALVGA